MLSSAETDLIRGYLYNRASSVAHLGMKTKNFKIGLYLPYYKHYAFHGTRKFGSRYGSPIMQNNVRSIAK